MPKKFIVNAKQEEGRARKASAAAAKQQAKAQQQEVQLGKYWQEGAKDDSKQRAEEAKKLEKLAAKKARLDALQKEEEELVEKYGKGKGISHATQSNALASDSLLSMRGSSSSFSSMDNDAGVEAYAASNIDDAIFLLDATSASSSAPSSSPNWSPTVDRHPERRMKAAYQAFEERELPSLKATYPTLRHTQLLQMLSKKWKKSPDNPFNQPHISYEASKEEERAVAKGIIEEKLDHMRIQ